MLLVPSTKESGMAIRRRTEPMTQVGPHEFKPLRRFFNKGRCEACYLHEDYHPVNGWTQARPMFDFKVAVYPE
jgi:hypothetical protein